MLQKLKHTSSDEVKCSVEATNQKPQQLRLIPFDELLVVWCSLRYYGTKILYNTITIYHTYVWYYGMFRLSSLFVILFVDLFCLFVRFVCLFCLFVLFVCCPFHSLLCRLSTARIRCSQYFLTLMTIIF
jgi:hypothetical protein